MTLETLDLNFHESKVYLFLLALGKSNLSEIMYHCNLTTYETKEAINGLLEKRLIEELAGFIDYYKALFPFDAFKDATNDSLKAIEQLDENFDDELAINIREIIEQLKVRESNLNNSVIKVLTEWESSNIPIISERVTQNTQGFTKEVNSCITDMKNNLEANIGNKAEESNKYLESHFDGFKSVVEDKIEELSKISEYFSSSYGLLESFENSERERITKDNEILEEKFEKLQKIIEEKISNVYQQMINFEETALSIIDETNNTLKKHLQEVNSTPSDLIDKTTQQIESNVLEQINKNNETLANKIRAFRANITDELVTTQKKVEYEADQAASYLEKNFSTLFPSLEEMINNSLSEVQHRAIEPVVESKNLIDKSFSSFKETLKNLTNNNFNTTITQTDSFLDELQDNLLDQIQTTITKINQGMIDFRKEIKDKITDFFTLEHGELVKKGDKLKDEVSFQLKSFSETIKDGTGEIVSILQKVETVGTSELSSREKTIRKFTNKLETLAVNFNKIEEIIFSLIDQYQEEIKNHIESTQSEPAGEIEGEISEYETEIKNKLEHINVLVKESIEKAKDQSIETIKKTQAEIGEITNRFTLDLNNNVSQELDKSHQLIEGLMVETAKAVTDQLNNTKKEALDKVKNFNYHLRNESGNNFQSLISDINQKADELASILLASSTTLSESMVKDFKTLEDDMRNQLSHLNQEGQNKLDNLTNSLKENIKNNIQAFNERSKNETESLTVTLKEVENFNKLSKEETLKQLTTTITEMRKQYELANNQITTTIENTKNGCLTIFKEASLELQDKIRNLDRNYNEEFSQIMNKTIDCISQKTSLLKSIILENLKNVINSSAYTLDQTKKLIRDEFTEYVKMEELQAFGTEFKKLVDVNKEILTKHLKMLEDLEKHSRVVELSSIKTATLISRKVVLYTIEHLLDRVRGYVTLIIPNPNEIPLEKVLETKDSQRVNIITDADPYDDYEILSKLLKKGNIKVRTLDKKRFEDFGLYLGADVDGEILIFGVSDINKMDEMIAVATENSDFVRLVGKVLLGDLTARSREFKSTDFDL